MTDPRHEFCMKIPYTDAKYDLTRLYDTVNFKGSTKGDNGHWDPWAVYWISLDYKKSFALPFVTLPQNKYLFIFSVSESQSVDLYCFVDFINADI